MTDINYSTLDQAQIGQVRRPVFFAGLFIICAANALSQPIANMLATEGLIKSAFTLFGYSPIVIFALSVGFWRLFTLECDGKVGKLDIVAAVFAVLASFVPWYLAGWLAMSLLAGHLVMTSWPDRRLRSTALLFLTVTFPLLWGPAILKMIGPGILATETSVIAAIFGLKSIGNTFISATDASSLTVFWPCSSFHSISLAIVGWTACAVMLDHETSRRDVPWIALSVLGVFLVNAIRLVAMALNPAHFQEIHYGYGADITNLATVTLIAACSFYGCRRA